MIGTSSSALPTPRLPADLPVAVCVPVRDEAAALPRLLMALRDQQGTRDLAPTLCCFLDECRDASEAVIRRLLPSGWRLSLDCGPVHPDANAGRARGAAMMLGEAALAGRPGVLLSTDADSAPAADWLVSARRSLASCDLVVGAVERDDAAGDPVQGRLERYYDRLYRYRRLVDPVAWEAGDGHHYTGGANLGIWAEAYRALGGFRPLPTGEDAVLVDDAARAGLKVRRDPRMRVQTSARRLGRATGGLAATLAWGDAVGEAGLRVGDPTGVAWQYARHAAARAAFGLLDDPARAAALGRELGLAGDHVVGVARDCPNAEAFAMRVVPAAPGQGGELPLAEAERALLALERAIAGAAA